MYQNNTFKHLSPYWLGLTLIVAGISMGLNGLFIKYLTELKLARERTVEHVMGFEMYKTQNGYELLKKIESVQTFTTVEEAEKAVKAIPENDIENHDIQ